ncbi:hypothetical protein GPECTOR_3g71 [Gonium pectorale]|uniref:Uncharacterized protein n=1 Tax=Gonium pectorale TaxID=33097 RepID=A0A150H1H9_GONPE|nr:hypothetical protein GPECTOR_3g71 [Gonium pectorale]|eukprot:KXZ55420.1 hypothetical protein GPECTOR_3g71 [Gonium pectorale]
MDELLLLVVASVNEINDLQIILLSIEGFAVTCFAAWYLSRLLKEIATQRLGLYRAFLMIPVGLSRILASQNTALIMDDDEDEGDEDALLEDELNQELARGREQQEGGAGGEAAAPGAKGSRTSRRRSVVLDLDLDAGGGAGGGVGAQRTGSSRGGGGAGYERQTSSPGAAVARAGCWDGLVAWARRTMLLKARSVRAVAVEPLLPQAVSGGRGGGGGASFNTTASSRRVLLDDSRDTLLMMVPFLLWSALVIAIYTSSVVKMKIFMAQELAVVEDPVELPGKRSSLAQALKLARDAWLTLQLGNKAYQAGGPDTERFPLVKKGLAHASTQLSSLMYGTGSCPRLPVHQPCPGPSYRFYQLTLVGMDGMMEQFMMALSMMANNKSMIPEGVMDEHFDFVYSIGTQDLVDGTIRIKLAHYDLIQQLFEGILLLHTVLFLLLWLIFAGFIAFMLRPLLRRIVLERRRIAELMSQLPLELDVEKLLLRALESDGAAGTGAAGDKATDAGEKSGLNEDGGSSRRARPN